MRRAHTRCRAATRRHLAGFALLLLVLFTAACEPAAAGAPSSTPTPTAPPSLYVVGSHASTGHGGGTDTLSALRASDGQLRWSVLLSGQNRGPAVTSGGVVYVGGETGAVKSGPGALAARPGSEHCPR